MTAVCFIFWPCKAKFPFLSNCFVWFWLWEELRSDTFSWKPWKWKEKFNTVCPKEKRIKLNFLKMSEYTLTFVFLVSQFFPSSLHWNKGAAYDKSSDRFVEKSKNRLCKLDNTSFICRWHSKRKRNLKQIHFKRRTSRQISFSIVFKSVTFLYKQKYLYTSV